MSVSRHHADWLSLVEVSGPFVSLPVLLRIFPQGLEPRDPAQAKALRSVYEEWNDNPTAPGRQRAWLLYVLTAILGYPQDRITEGQSLPAGLETSIPEMSETLRPDFALVSPQHSNDSGQAQLLVTSYPVNQGLDKPVIGKHWKATPATRMMELLHGTGIPLGLVTNGEQWMLVYAPRGETTGYASWYGNLWMDEPITLRAFHSLLGVRRFFGVATDSTLLALLKESAQDQQEVTDQLGYQVREAVEVLVQSFDALDKESGRQLLKGVSEITIYDAALTIMMRLVFLFAAEERGLLHLGKPLYDDNYAVSTLQEQLQEVADRYGEEVLERRLDAWARLLATFRAVYGGIQHQDLLMQAYGGSLFDPDRYPFLEGRSAGTLWHTTVAEPLAVNNRVVLHLLNSLQRLRTKVGTGTTTETRRVSFRALGVEQIGHVYEGLLDHTAIRANEPILGIKGTRSKEPEIPLSTLESLLTQGTDKLFDYLKQETGRTTISPIKRAFEECSLLNEHKILIACNQDEALFTRLRPFIGLIRDDSFERPLVILPGSVFVTAGTARRSTGTHYTPPSLTEPIVKHTLEPLIYEGPSEGWPREQWILNSPKAILDLKVCDMTMGSGAFLVQTCRYLAERLGEAWENEEKKHPGKVLITPDGQFSEGLPSERLVPEDPDERIAIARRFIADRCLYGVDINPMAVEMAKLSMWLITVDANRPFTFLDHALKCGDSLLGVSKLEQIENFSLRSDVKQITFATAALYGYVEEAASKRRQLESLPSESTYIAEKISLHAKAEAATLNVKNIADVILAIELRELRPEAYEDVRSHEAEHVRRMIQQDIGREVNRNPSSNISDYSKKQLDGRVTFHWPLEFPEVFARGGFDAFVGNPPFLGGSKITGIYGTPFRDYLIRIISSSIAGKVDLCTYFYLRAFSCLKTGGAFGLIATNSIAQGDARVAGLDKLLQEGATIYRAVPNQRWPGIASVEVAIVWISKKDWYGEKVLNNQMVNKISSYLYEQTANNREPKRLINNANFVFRGTEVRGEGFVLDAETATNLISIRSSNRNVIFPYLSGEDLNSRPDMSPGRWIINFHDWNFEIASQYPECLAILTEKVKPYRETITKQIHESDYWKFWDKRLAEYARIAKMPRVLATAKVSPTNAVTWVKPGIVIHEKVIIFPLQESWVFGVLQSSFHWEWVRYYTSTLGGTTLNYSPRDCFETFPFPGPSPLVITESVANKLNAVSDQFYYARSKLMQKKQIGLTKIYNYLNNSSDKSENIMWLRATFTDMDYAVATAYGWQDIDLNHGFYETKQGIRYTICENARREVLDRLLTLNHQRHAEEKAAQSERPANASIKRARKKKKSDRQTLMDI